LKKYKYIFRYYPYDELWMIHEEETDYNSLDVPLSYGNFRYRTINASDKLKTAIGNIDVIMPDYNEKDCIYGYDTLEELIESHFTEILQG